MDGHSRGGRRSIFRMGGGGGGAKVRKCSTFYTVTVLYVQNDKDEKIVVPLTQLFLYYILVH